jgi:ribA/ribD-fused uncharacterized protein
MINDFRGSNAYLSNFFEAKVTYEGITYPTAEHAFQAQKTLDQGARRFIAAILYPNQAKTFGRGLKLRPDWEQVKVKIMYEILQAKFIDSLLTRTLLATGQEELVEGNHWGRQQQPKINP